MLATGISSFLSCVIKLLLCLNFLGSLILIAAVDLSKRFSKDRSLFHPPLLSALPLICSKSSSPIGWISYFIALGRGASGQARTKVKVMFSA
jgi:hypothetical protein